MNKIIITILFLSLFISVYPQNIEGTGYSFIKKENDICLYYRWRVAPGNLKVRELKAEFDIYSAPARIVSILKNEKVATRWMKGTCEVNQVGASGENLWYAYIQYDIPWPLSNQDCVVQYNLKCDPSDNSYLITMNGLPGFLPGKDGVTRIQHLEGTWSIVQVSKNISRVTYTVYSAQAPKFPRWITDPIVQGNLLQTMEAFKLTVEKNQQP